SSLCTATTPWHGCNCTWLPFTATTTLSICMSTICSACSIAFLIALTVSSMSTIAPFLMPLDVAVPTPIIFTESCNTSPIITLIPMFQYLNLQLLHHYSIYGHLHINHSVGKFLKICSYFHMNDSFFIIKL